MNPEIDPGPGLLGQGFLKRRVATGRTTRPNLKLSKKNVLLLDNGYHFSRFAAFKTIKYLSIISVHIYTYTTEYLCAYLYYVSVMLRRVENNSVRT